MITIAIHEDRTYEALRIARRWNGWAVPVVTRETALAIMQGLSDDEAGNAPRYRSVWWMDDRGVITLTMPDDDEPTIITPDGDGTYTLDIGWTFDTLDHDSDCVLCAEDDAAHHANSPRFATTEV